MSEPSSICIEGQLGEFDCAEGSYVLDAAIAHGIQLPYNCRGGACGTCKAQILEGAVEHGWVMGFGIDENEIRDGKCLICSCRPTSPRVVLRMLNQLPAAEGATILPGEYVAEILAVRHVSDSVCHITLQTDATRFVFDSGMYVEVVLPGIDPSRPYSIATVPEADGTAPDGMIDLLVARHNPGRASRYLYESARAGDMLDIRGPYGTFRLPAMTAENILMLAGGTGIAPLMAMAGSLLARGHTGTVELWSCVRTSRDVLVMDPLRRWAARHSNFRLRQFLSRSTSGNLPKDWVRGRIPDELHERLKVSAVDRIFTAGSPGFVAACTGSALGAGFAAQAIHSESYDSRPTAV